MIEFRMPSLGADMEAGTLREWLVKPGDTVKRGDIIAVVETQKGLIEIEVFNDGKIDQLLLKEEEKVPVGTIMALIIGDAKPSPPKVEPAVVPPAKEQPVLHVEHPASHRLKVSPLARKIAEENHIDLSTITGTGEDHSITRHDVEEAMLSKPKTSVGTSASTDSIRAAVAAAMSRSNKEIPHYYLVARIDMHNALQWLSALNRQRSVEKRILPVALTMKAVAKALRDVPQLNATWENGLQLKKEINIGFVVALRSGGILIPAVRQADAKNIDEMMSALSDIILRAREMKLRSSELSESTITVTNLGDNTAEAVFGVIYPPQVALVGFGEIAEQPWAENGMVGVRPVLTITLAGDHRASDGTTGSRFLSVIKNYLQHPESL